MRSFILLYVLFTLAYNVFGDRTFIAVPKEASLKRSNVGLEPSLDLQKLVYYNHDGKTGMAASVVLVPKIPILLHEDVDDSLQILRVSCVNLGSQSEMDVEFFYADTVKEVAVTWANYTEFVIITPTWNCARGGEQTPYIVSFFAADVNRHKVTLRATESTLQNVTERMFVDVGEHVVPQMDHRKYKRQAGASSSFVPYASAYSSYVPPPTTSSTRTTSTTTRTSASATASSASGAFSSLLSSLTSSVSQSATTVTASSGSGSSNTFPAFTYTSTNASPTGSSFGPQDISFSEIGTVLIPPDNKIAAYVAAQTVPNVKLTCTNCTLSGSVAFKAAGFTISSSTTTTLSNFFTDGFLEFDATNVAANMSFELDLKPGFTISTYLANLPRRTLGAIQIAGLVTFSPVMDLTFPVSITLNTPAKIRTGFTMSPFPSGQVILDINDPASSRATGFNTSVTPLPFDADSPDLSFSVSASFRPMLSISAGLFSGSSSSNRLSGGVGVYLDLPKFTAQVDEVHNVNDQCQPDSSKDNAYIHVIPSVTFDSGVVYSVAGSVSGLDIPSNLQNSQRQLNSSTFDLQEECLRWNSNTNSLVMISGPSVDGGAGSSGGGLSTGAKAGIGVGIAGGVLLAGGLVAFFLLRRRKNKKAQAQQDQQGMQHVNTNEFGTAANRAQLDNQRANGGAAAGVPELSEKQGPHQNQFYGRQHNNPYEMDAYQAQYVNHAEMYGGPPPAAQMPAREDMSQYGGYQQQPAAHGYPAELRNREDMSQYGGARAGTETGTGSTYTHVGSGYADGSASDNTMYHHDDGSRTGWQRAQRDY